MLQSCTAVIPEAKCVKEVPALVGALMSGWATSAQVATTFGAAVGAASLFFGFISFRSSRRYQYVSDFRSVLSRIRSTCDRLAAQITYEMANELTMAAVYARDFHVFFEDVYKSYRNDTPEDFSSLVKAKLAQSPITVAIHTEFTQMYQRALEDVTPAIARYQTDFPGVYRVTKAVADTLSRIPRLFKRFIRSEEVWEDVLLRIKVEQPTLPDKNHFRVAFASELIDELLRHLEDTRKGIVDLVEVLKIAIDAHLSVKDSRLIKERKHERSVKLKPKAELDTVAEELYEDLKALMSLLEDNKTAEHNPVLAYHKRVAQFEERHRVED